MTARSPKRRPVAILAAVCALLLSCIGIAHEVRPAYLEITQHGPDTVEVLFKQPAMGTQLLRLVPEISNLKLPAAPSQEYATNSFLVRRWSGIRVAPETFDGATLRIEGLEYSITDALVQVNLSRGEAFQAILHPNSSEVTVRIDGAGHVAVPAYLLLGIEHILTGFDHLSFVLGLLLLVKSRKKLIQTVTAFTVAHSVTLGAAALGWVHVNPAVIEALVAFSIVFVALEVLRSYRGEHGLTVRYPWLIAGSFGLLHGFAFAGSLAQIGLPEHNIPLSLFLFNVGVEIGQLLFVAVALGLKALLERLPRLPNWTTFVPPYAIGSLASFWVLQRLSVLIH
jgi:hydrogenase/urease accessory protein HupE